MAAREFLEAGGGALAARHVAGRVALYAALLFFSVLFLFPLAWMISTALKDIRDVNSAQPVWIPWPC